MENLSLTPKLGAKSYCLHSVSLSWPPSLRYLPNATERHCSLYAGPLLAHIIAQAVERLIWICPSHCVSPVWSLPGMSFSYDTSSFQASFCAALTQHKGFSCGNKVAPDKIRENIGDTFHWHFTWGKRRLRHAQSKSYSTGNVLILDCRAQSPCAAIAKVMVAAAQLFPRNAATLPFYFWALLHA